jgi:hypothetical protein
MGARGHKDVRTGPDIFLGNMYVNNVPIFVNKKTTNNVYLSILRSLSHNLVVGF